MAKPAPEPVTIFSVDLNYDGDPVIFHAVGKLTDKLWISEVRTGASRGFGFRCQIPRAEIFLTPESAIAAWREATEARLDACRRTIERLEGQLATEILPVKEGGFS